MIDSIVTAIVRPPRARYSLQDLGSKNIRHKGIEYHREDFTIKNNKDFNINGSIWCLSYPSKGDSDSCIIYLHPNSGSRVDVIKTRIMTIAANSKCAVCGFDFAGCGESQGDNISLGVNEKDDLCAILSYLYQKGYKKYILWGRSMGAATAVIFYGAYRELVKGTVLGLVLDSPFTSMQGLAEEYSSTRVGVPSILLSPAVHYLRHTIQTNYNFDLYHMTPIGAAPRIDIPTIVLSGSEDKIVPPKLSEELYEAFAGPKMRIFFQGGHNTHRPSPIYEAIRVFVVGILRGLPVVDVLNMSTEVLKNQLIEFPQFQLPSQNEINTNSNTASNSNLTDNNNNNNNNKQEINLQQQQQTVKDRRSSVDSQVDDALQITVESARTLEPLRIIGDIKIETESDNLSPSSSEIFTSIAEEVEKKLSVEEKTESSWSSIPVSSNSDINNNNNKLHNNHKHHHSSNKKHENGHSENGHHENGNGYSNGHGNGHAQPQQQHDRTKKLANQQQKLNQSKPCVYSISIDYGQEDDNSSNNSKNEQLPETSTWMGAVGMLFGYSNLSQNQQLSPLIVHSGQYEGSRIGSYGYLMNQIGNTMCPPDKIVWEKLLISRCEEIILDIVCDQLITLSSGLLDYTKSDKPNEIISSSLIPPDIPPDERCLLMSMIVAEISSSIGLLSSVGGEETLNWGKLILSSDNELISIISDHESQKILEKKNQMKQIQEENLNKKNEEKFDNNKNDNNYIKKSDNINKKDGQDKEIRVISIVV